MALKSTVFKAEVQLADLDRQHFGDYSLTLARHPSETDERMMIRLAALALQAHRVQSDCGGDAQIAFGAGLSSPNEPDVWLRDFTGRTRLWVEVGQPEERPVLKACQQSDAVVVYAFSHAAEVWWRGIESKLARLDKLTVWRIPADASRQLAALAERGMQLQATVQEGQLWMASAKGSVMVEPQCWKPLSNE